MPGGPPGFTGGTLSSRWVSSQGSLVLMLPFHCRWCLRVTGGECAGETLPPAKGHAAVGKFWCILVGIVLWETGFGMSAPLCVLTEVTSDGHFHWVFTMGRVLLPRPLGLACDGVNPLSPTNGQLTHH